MHCVSAYEGDIVIMGSDGVFDNLFLDEILEMANGMLPAQAQNCRVRQNTRQPIRNE